jgi:Zn-finger nucleic acid-binding protein
MSTTKTRTRGRTLRPERYWRATPVAARLRQKAQADQDVFFRRRDRELLRKLRAANDEKRRDYVRELAHMRCPECGRPLAIVPHLGVRVAECPAHHGMWLTEQERHALANRERHSWLGRYLHQSMSPDARFRPLT